MTTLLMSQFLIYGLAWAVAAALLRDGRRAVCWWGAYCVLQAGGLHLLAQQAPDVVLATLPACVILSAYVCADIGIDLFTQGPHARRARHARLWLALWLAGLAGQLATVGAPAHLRGVAYNLGVAALLLAPLLTQHRRLHAEFGWLGVLPLVPGALICAATLLRSLAILADPGAFTAAQRPAMSDNPALLLVALVAAGAFNIAFLGLLIGRLVLRLARQAGEDPLTGLANRGRLEEQLAQAWAAGRRHGSGLSLAFIDIDAFKQINDRGGHEAGDRVIRAVADVLRRHARQTDFVGRWGGDEFMLVMPQTGHDAAVHAVQRLREQVLHAGIAVPAGCPALTLSVGLATREAADASVQALTQRADAEMYRLKRLRGSSTPQAPRLSPA